MKNLLLALLSLWVIVTLTFFLMKAVPGDPFNDEKGLPEEVHQALLQHYGLKDPLPIQYFTYLKNIATGNFGPSLIYKDHSITQLIAQAFPISAFIGCQAMILALLVGIPWGLYSAYTPNLSFQITSLLMTTLLMSFPSFISGALLQYLFNYQFTLSPNTLWDTFQQTALPVLTLALSPIAIISRLIRANASEILQCDYIITARAKGISEFKVVFRHCLKNAITPLLTYFGQIFANIVVGSFIIEKMFNIHGLGLWFVNSVYMRDYPMIMALTVFYSIIFISVMECCHFLYRLLNPHSQAEITHYAA